MGERDKIRKLNNKGLTLVELLVAIAILMLVIAPLMNAFLVSMRTNSKAKMLHKATTVAQNVMEGIKLTGLETLDEMFRTPVGVDDEGNPVKYFNVLTQGMLRYPVEYSVDIDTTTEDDKTVYSIRNIKMENSLFDAKITMDASPYRASTENGSDAPAGKGYNSDPIIQIPSINADYDAIVAQGDGYNGEALVMFANRYPDKIIKEEDLIRTIKIIISDTLLLSGETATTVMAEFVYQCKIDGAELSYTHTISPAAVFDNTADTVNRPLRSVYIYYYPLYTSQAGSVVDHIVIQNDANREIDLYLVKMEPYVVDTNLRSRESSYVAEVNINESWMNPPDTSKIKLHTNLGRNLYDIYEETAVNTPVTGGQAVYYLNGSLQGNGDDDTVKELFSITDLLNAKPKDRLVNVKVEIYRAASYGSLPEFIAADVTFAEADRLATITGMKSN